MAELVLRFEVDGPGAIVRSLLSVCEVLAASGRARKTLVDCFPDLAGAELDSGAPHLILDRFDLFVGEQVLDIAGGAGKCVLQPSDRYRRFVCALPADGHAAAEYDFHEWPHLSFATRHATATAAGGDASTGAVGREEVGGR